MCVLVLLALEEKLRVVEEILTIQDGDLVDASAQLVKVELTVFAHLSHIFIV